MATSRLTLLRALQYEAITGLHLTGRTLDVGGDSRSGYYRLLGHYDRIDTVNIQRQARPSCIADLNQPLPFLDNSFDHVLSLNTFEHVKNDCLAISEAVRVLRAGGTFHLSVPFCYRVHGSPEDFHRHTAEWWAQYLESQGIVQCRVEPLVWDRRSTGFAVMNAGRFVRAVAMLRALIATRRRVRRVVDTIRAINGTSVILSVTERDAMEAATTAAYAVGYYISGEKPAAC